MKKRVEEQARNQILYQTQLTITSFGFEIVKTFVTYTAIKSVAFKSKKVRWVFAIMIGLKCFCIGYPVSVELATITKTSAFTFSDTMVLHS